MHPLWMCLPVLTATTFSCSASSSASGQGFEHLQFIPTHRHTAHFLGGAFYSISMLPRLRTFSLFNRGVPDQRFRWSFYEPRT